MISVLTLSLLISLGYLLNFEEISPEAKRYEWKKVCNVGDTRWQRWLAPVVAFDGKLWMVGQDTRTGFVWESSDGINWTKHSTNARWGVRYGMTTVYFKNRLFMFGGTLHTETRSSTARTLMNDIWYSNDGIDWKQADTNAGWSPSHFPVIVVFRDALWFLGGANVWTSADGLRWTESHVVTPWAGKTVTGWFADGNQLVVVTGEGVVWKSEDGIHWTNSHAEEPWPNNNRIGGCYGKYFDGSVWLMGGSADDAQFRNDVWHSQDGVRWTRLEEHAPWSPRATNYSVVFNNKLWIYGGKNGEDDVWTLSATSNKSHKK